MAVMQRNRSGWNSPSGTGGSSGNVATLDINYTLEIDGLLAGHFLSLKGGDMEISVISHDVTFETGDSTTLMIPGPISFSPITLSRGFGFNEQLYRWLDASVKGDTIQARRNGTITLNQRGSQGSGGSPGTYAPVVTWNLFDAWLMKISGFGMNQYVGASYATMTIVIVAETIERVEP